MNAKTFFSLAVVVLVIVFLAGMPNPQANVGLPITSRPLPSASEAKAPDHIIYGFMFHRVISLTDKIKELQTQGKIGREPRFPLQKEAKLTEIQARSLETIANTCEQEIRRQDEKAQVIIQRLRAEFAGGKSPTATRLEATETVLKAMWEERNAIVIKARDKLRLTFGEEEFSRFDQYVRETHLVNGSIKGGLGRRHAMQR